MFENKTVSIASQIYDKLEHEILSGKYERGEILTENGLSEYLGVSRTPIREAIHHLEHERLVKTTQKGITVVGITPEDNDMIYEIRLRIEGLASRLAAENATEEELKKLKDIIDLQEFYTMKENSAEIGFEDGIFHREIYKVANSIPLATVLSALHKKAEKYRTASVCLKKRAKESLEEHKQIYEAIAAHNGDLAEELTLKHISKARNNIKNGGNR